ncbi:hypothetical protein [Burkholderia ubonensis]|uniref:hypothetical protein n=1 Tax=Burkholderia ubonensis TaxID=101571 RepID=UPI0012FACBA5|nr:hypothetical protein [Burkholderia ubonensis]
MKFHRKLLILKHQRQIRDASQSAHQLHWRNRMLQRKQQPVNNIDTAIDDIDG